LLVVQEKSGKLKGMGVWKIPTGVVDEVFSLTNLILHYLKAKRILLPDIKGAP